MELSAKAHSETRAAEVTKPQFRPDIEGMRALAVALVIMFHAYRVPVTGGYVGVEVFFVISGFLITSLLLGESARTGHVSIARFCGRRVRRILPAATAAILFASYWLLGFVTGNSVADDAKWTAIFAANIHFGLIGTDYLGSQLAPSPLQHMWSLGVEEQFYIVWPGLFVAIVIIARVRTQRAAKPVAAPG